jgi:uncharacterized protein YciI
MATLTIITVFSWINTAKIVGGAVEEMTTFQLVFLKKNPDWKARSSTEVQSIEVAHQEFFDGLIQSDQVLVSGLVTDESDLRAIIVSSATTMQQAQSIVASDPAVKVGMLRAETYAWYAGKLHLRSRIFRNRTWRISGGWVRQANSSSLGLSKMEDNYEGSMCSN